MLGAVLQNPINGYNASQDHVDWSCYRKRKHICVRRLKMSRFTEGRDFELET